MNFLGRLHTGLLAALHYGQNGPREQRGVEFRCAVACPTPLDRAMKEANFLAGNSLLMSLIVTSCRQRVCILAAGRKYNALASLLIISIGLVTMPRPRQAPLTWQPHLSSYGTILRSLSLIVMRGARQPFLRPLPNAMLYEKGRFLLHPV